MDSSASTIPTCGLGDEPELIRRFVSGDRGAFEHIVSLYAPRAGALAFRLLGWRGDVDDIVQDVFLIALERSSRFRADSSLWTWLTSITLNRCRVNWRRRRIRELGCRLLAGAVPTSPGADRRMIDDETSTQVRAAVAALRPRLREVIVLYYLEEMPTDQVAAAVGAPRGTVEVRLHRGRQQLRRTLRQLIEDEHP
jgi:RNA polymerase sigma-70 factor (ECF subfamily)